MIVMVNYAAHTQALEIRWLRDYFLTVFGQKCQILYFLNLDLITFLQLVQSVGDGEGDLSLLLPDDRQVASGVPQHRPTLGLEKYSKYSHNGKILIM